MDSQVSRVQRRSCYEDVTEKATFAIFDKKFNFLLRRDHQKISYECRVYESVEDKSLS